MAKVRVINTRFWVDDYTSNLDPIEKLLFFYFLTNQATEICGIYELPLKTIATESGIDRDMVTRILERFSRDEKIYYVNGWVAIVNFIKHQTLNPSVKIGIQRSVELVPREVIDRLGTDWVQSLHSVADLTKLNLTKLNSIQTKKSRSAKKEDSIHSGNGENSQDSAISELFEEFWTLYPSTHRNMRKDDCRAKLTKGTDEAIMKERVQKLRDQKAKDRKWLAGFIPNLSTYINQQRWNMDVEIEKGTPGIFKNKNNEMVDKLNKKVMRE